MAAWGSFLQNQASFALFFILFHPSSTWNKDVMAGALATILGHDNKGYTLGKVEW